MTNEELYWLGPEGNLGDYDDDFLIADDGSTAVSNGGLGMTRAESTTVPSFNSRRKRKRLSINIPHDPKEAGGFQNSMKVV